MGCVYIVTNIRNNKHYIGMSKNSAKVRFAGHLRYAFARKDKGIFADAIRKHGINAFSVRTIFESDDIQKLYFVEKLMIRI